MRKVDVLGTVFNRLTVIEGTRFNDLKNYWEQHYLCTCGTAVWLRPSAVRRGNTKSCGCLNKELYKIRAKKHGAKSGGNTLPSYTSWQQMKDRCYNTQSKSYKYYGALGITVCTEWLDYNKFVTDMGEPPFKYTLDRIDNTKGYYKENCRWASRLTQSRNRDYCIKYEYQGSVLTASEWATRLGLCVEQFRNRVRKYRKNPTEAQYTDIFKGKQTWRLSLP